MSPPFACSYTPSSRFQETLSGIHGGMRPTCAPPMAVRDGRLHGWSNGGRSLLPFILCPRPPPQPQETYTQTLRIPEVRPPAGCTVAAMQESSARVQETLSSKLLSHASCWCLTWGSLGPQATWLVHPGLHLWPFLTILFTLLYFMPPPPHTHTQSHSCSHLIDQPTSLRQRPHG